jgi:hypothetical protein
MGLYVAVGIPPAWLPTNLPRNAKRTFAIGLQVMIGNMSGIMAPFFYPATDGPRYVKGHSITLALVGFAAVVYALMSWWLRRDSVQGINNIGDQNRRSLYTY